MVLRFVVLFSILLTAFSADNNLDEAMSNSFRAAKALANDVANLIYQRFEFHNYERYQFFLEVSGSNNYLI